MKDERMIRVKIITTVVDIVVGTMIVTDDIVTVKDVVRVTDIVVIVTVVIVTMKNQSVGPKVKKLNKPKLKLLKRRQQM